jgi:hypothetical protein
MYAAEIVIGMVDRNHVAMVFEFLGERIREASKAPDTHSQIQILPFDVASRDVIPVGIAAQDACADADASSGAVARI